MIADASLLPLLEPVAARLPVEHVIVAGGDFSASKDLRARYFPQEVVNAEPVNKLVTGEIFHIGEKYGAKIVNGDVEGAYIPKLRFVPLEFVERTEKIDDYTVRVIEKRPTAWDLARFDTAIYPAAIHSKLADKSEFGRKAPIGTGPYRFTKVEAPVQFELERFDGYFADSPKPKPPIRRLVIREVTDTTTALNELIGAFIVIGGVLLVQRSR